MTGGRGAGRRTWGAGGAAPLCYPAPVYVIGTAGHVDHGKSTLVQALTGIDPDRLREEKERGLTIDLGFAWLTLPSGREVSIVDVPGHARFIKNMLAGAGGVDLALLIVAADESVMPQTREHLAILDLLGVRRGLAVITKRDLADPDLLELAQLEVEEAMAGTALDGSSVLAVSAVTGEGLGELRAAMDEALNATQQRQDVGRPRLAIDRAFTMPGFGSVVTGTLIDGALRVGQQVELAQSGKTARIRGLQTHRATIEEAQPGTRVAVNLSGLSADELERGEVLTSPGWLRPSKAADARLRLLPGAPRALRHNAPVTFHAHTTETPAKVRLLEQETLEPGGEAWAQVVAEQAAPLAPGDRFVVRSSEETLGGGVIVDVGARRHRRRDSAVIARLRTLAQGSAAARLITALEAGEPADLAALARRANVSDAEAAGLARQAATEGQAVELEGGLFMTTAGWARVSARAEQALAAFHALHPLRQGMPREELRSRLGLKGAAGRAALNRLAASGAAADDGETMRLPEHAVSVDAEQQAAMDAYVARLADDPFAAETPAIASDLLGLLAEQRRVVHTGAGVVFERNAYEAIAARVVEHVRERGAATVADVRDLLGTSRKYALALLEHMDDEKVTRRQGDTRTLLRE